jgi:hypothetical protein
MLEVGKINGEGPIIAPDAGRRYIGTGQPYRAAI